MLIVAHRGGAGEAPENSLEAFRKAVTSGCDRVECDVHLTRDGVPIVIHDAAIDRVTLQGGLVREMSAADIQRIPLKGGETIPTLMQVLDVCSGVLEMHIELKAPGTPEKVHRCLEAGGRSAGAIITSFDAHLLEETRSLNPQVRLCLLARDADEIARDAVRRLGISMFGARFDRADEALVRAVHDRGLEMYIFHVNDWGDAVRFAQMGVDAISTDYPRAFVRRFRRQRTRE